MRHFTDDQIMAQVRAILSEKTEDTVFVFACNWCSYAGGDMAGISRIQYPASNRVIRTMCSARVSEEMVLEAFRCGAPTVLVSGCHYADCHYINANRQTVKRVQSLWNKLEKAGSYFKKKEVKGARSLFVLGYGEKENRLLFFNPETGVMEDSGHSDESMAVWAAASPWSFMRKKGSKVKSAALAADPTGYLEAAPDYFVLWMGLICLALDIYYIVRLRARRAEQAAGILRRDELTEELLARLQPTITYFEEDWASS